MTRPILRFSIAMRLKWIISSRRRKSLIVLSSLLFLITSLYYIIIVSPSQHCALLDDSLLDNCISSDVGQGLVHRRVRSVHSVSNLASSENSISDQRQSRSLDSMSYPIQSDSGINIQSNTEDFVSSRNQFRDIAPEQSGKVADNKDAEEREFIPKEFQKICFLDNSSNRGKDRFYYRTKPVDINRFLKENSETRIDRIPKIIHRTWKTVIVPEKWISGDISCRRANLDHLYCHWTDKELRDFIATLYSCFLPIYDSYPYNIQRVDAARYFILYHYGGLYIDYDLMCRTSFSGLFNTEGKLNEIHDVLLAAAQPMGVVADFIASKPRQDFLRHIISGLCVSSQMPYLLPYVTVMSSTGPWYLSHRHHIYKSSRSPLNATLSRVKVLKQRFYNSRMFGHLNGATWHEWDGWIIWNLYQIYNTTSLLGIITLLTVIFVVLTCCCAVVRRYITFR